MSEVKGLSILIPIYNQDVRPLVNQLLEQAKESGLAFEIRCYDDDSSPEIKKINQELGTNKNVIYSELPSNIGRSAIRNKLANEAIYSYLLFLDCNIIIIRKDFLKKYIESAEGSSVVIGGSVYDYEPDKAYSLRWKYGKAREERSAKDRSLDPYKGIILKNIFIKKNIYLENVLDENIKTYGHEDTKFGNMLKEKRIGIVHIDNPVRHAELETNEVFIKKTLDGIKNYYKLIKEGYAGNSRLLTIYNIIKLFPLRNIFTALYKMMEPNIRRNLLSENPSLLYFDLLKLRALIEEEENSKFKIQNSKFE
jgi:glycosyltransferase involved in cell wall biosynthesis